MDDILEKKIPVKLLEPLTQTKTDMRVEGSLAEKRGLSRRKDRKG